MVTQQEQSILEWLDSISGPVISGHPSVQKTTGEHFHFGKESANDLVNQAFKLQVRLHSLASE